MSAHRASLISRAVTVAIATVVLGAAITQGGSAHATTPRVLTVAQIDHETPRQLFAGGLAIPPSSVPAAEVIALTKAHKTAEAKEIKQIGSQPIATWLGDWDSQAQLTKIISATLASAAKAARTPVFVTYAIPDRDCGGYSAGGLTSTQYLAWNKTIANDLRGHRVAVLVEPDSLALISSCPDVASTRLPLLKSAVTTLASAGVTTYLDGGDSNWVDPATMATRLQEAGISEARGFFTNVSNFYPLSKEVAYANKLSALTSGSHYVVDVSRDGQGWKGTWCNPSGAGLGANPAVATGKTKLDATLWVKTPGESDGTCNGGPAAGSWWESYALALVKHRAK